MHPKENTSPGFFVPAQQTRVHYSASNSRFIATIAAASSVEEARAFIGATKKEFPDSSHNVPAYIIGGGKSVIEYCTDDGEPSGTSGIPALTVLRGSGLGDVVLVITRYFGGTLLGKGGLVKAYTESAKLAVEAVPRARRIQVCELDIEIPYNLLENVRRMVASCDGWIQAESFTDNVKMNMLIPAVSLTRFQADIRDLSAGKVIPLPVATTDVLVPVTGQ